MLYNLLNKKLKDDFWKIINKEQIKEVNFEEVVLNELIGVGGITVGEILLLAKNLRDSYNQSLVEIYGLIENVCVDLLKSMKQIKKNFNVRVKPIINEIKRKKLIYNVR